ncbi:hypothetical protein QQX98_006656 [Neonectria punicea]|uniref:Uncharacterized protein n=1 Tax=Neonectria punicea TaxID=979145 RepID=A0ABR1H031_9HYPO
MEVNDSLASDASSDASTTDASGPPKKRRRTPAELDLMVKDPNPPTNLQNRYANSAIKTPRPDIFVGIKEKALASALSSKGLIITKAETFIQCIQDQMVQHDKGGPLEPFLLVSPAELGADLTFPFVIFEAKAYSTGKQIFEAENQAAVALACAHRILLRLDSVPCPGKGTKNTRPRVLFSFTTQGPIYELWAHWTTFRDDQRVFESKLWGSWNVLLLDRAEEFLEKLNNVLVWGMGPFMKSVVETKGDRKAGSGLSYFINKSVFKL